MFVWHGGLEASKVVILCLFAMDWKCKCVSECLVHRKVTDPLFYVLSIRSLKSQAEV